MERLDQDLKTKNFQKLYLLYGDEAYLRLNYKKALISAISGEDSMNVNIYEGKDINIGALIDQAETMPFFSDRRLIVIENSNLLKSGNDQFTDYLSSMPDYLYMIIVETEVDKRSRTFKACQKIGCEVELTPYNEMKMKQWMASILKKSGKRMTERDMNYMLMLTGDNMENIKSELDKLVNYAWDKDIIDSNDIDDIVTRQIGDNIFKMIDAMGNRRQEEALEFYYDLLAKKEPPMKILSLIGRQYNLIIQTKELLEKRTPDSRIASLIKVPPFAVKNYISQARKYDFAALKSALDAVVNADEDIKTGRMTDKLSIELLIISLSQ